MPATAPETVEETEKATGPMVSHTGVPLTRSTTFRFTLDPTKKQHQTLLAHAGAARLMFNHHIARVKANLDQREAERSYGITEKDLTPSLSWSKNSFINHANQWKDGRDPRAWETTLDDGTVVRGIPWRDEVSADVFECASVNAAQALENFAASKKGNRAGKRVNFPKFKSRHRTKPAFRLRAKYTEGCTPPVRPTGARSMRFPKLGEIRVHEHTGRLAKMLRNGRFHSYAAAFTYERGKWVVSITGVAAEFHHHRRTTNTNRHPSRVGVDLGVKTLAVVADEHGSQLQAYQGVKALQHAQARLKLANQAYSRTKTGSHGRTKAARRLGRMHARVAAIRKNLLHQITSDLAKGYTTVVIEDLKAGMLQLRSLARHVADASFGGLRRQLKYKCAWYGTELVIADRWFPSSKTCSGCGTVDADLTLADRVYDCGHCGLVLDRDLNAAINLARYELNSVSPPLPAAA